MAADVGDDHEAVRIHCLQAFVEALGGDFFNGLVAARAQSKNDQRSDVSKQHDGNHREHGMTETREPSGNLTDKVAKDKASRKPRCAIE